jgi:hypothetical protein
MESNNQEKYNLMHDNPVASHASWMSKHAQSSRMSPLNQEKKGETYMTYDDRTNKDGVSQTDLMNKKQAAGEAAVKAYNAGTGTYNAYTEGRDAFNKSKDSISNVNKRIDRVMKGEPFTLSDD